MNLNYFKSYLIARIPPEQEARYAPTPEIRERQDYDRKHPHGHRQDQGLRIQVEHHQMQILLIRVLS